MNAVSFVPTILMRSPALRPRSPIAASTAVNPTAGRACRFWHSRIDKCMPIVDACAGSRGDVTGDWADALVSHTSGGRDGGATDPRDGVPGAPLLFERPARARTGHPGRSRRVRAAAAGAALGVDVSRPRAAPRPGY